MNEDKIAALALGKTVVFLIYSLLVPVLIVIPLLIYMEGRVAQDTANLISYIVFFICEIILLFLVIKNYLPGSKITVDVPFSEKQIAWSLNLLSVLSYFVFGFTLKGKAIRWVINGAIILCLIIYFAAKSMVSKQFRFDILYGLIIPVSHFFIGSTP